jgi:hypothetical protein
MGVKDTRLVTRRNACDLATECRMKALRTSERRHGDAVAAQAFCPRTVLVKATDGHRYLVSEPAHDFEDEPFGSAWMEAEDDLKDPGCVGGHVVLS